VFEPERQQWASDLKRLIESLPAQQITATRLVYFHGQSFHEAAVAMGIPVNDVARLIADATRQLGQLISNDRGDRRSAGVDGSTAEPSHRGATDHIAAAIGTPVGRHLAAS
jgi:predicted DNA-binding protein (UPF0251 family)